MVDCHSLCVYVLYILVVSVACILKSLFPANELTLRHRSGQFVTFARLGYRSVKRRIESYFITVLKVNFKHVGRLLALHFKCVIVHVLLY
jgi:hypothetical protein